MNRRQSSKEGFRLLMAAERRRDRRAIAALVHSDQPRLVRVGGVQSLHKNFGANAIDELAAAVGSPDDDVRMAAAVALQRLKDEKAAEILRAHVDDPVDVVAARSVAALPLLGNRVSIPLALEALRDGGPKTRRCAADVLLASEHPHAIDALRGMRGRDLPTLRHRVLRRVRLFVTPF
jgi:HEAT repeat protein